MAEPHDTLELWDYRRRVADIYRDVRSSSPDLAAWQRWRAERDRLLADHPQSALDAAQRVAFDGLEYFPYDPAWRFAAEIEAADGESAELRHSAAGSTGSTLFGVANLFIGAHSVTLNLYWLDDYGGGVFLPFRDETNGEASYGGGRYLLDTAKGADLGHVETKVVLDFNYAYHPSCAYNPMWSCPLAPPANHIDLPVRAGERLAEE
ncbi:MAG: DUF1684 domain-containing protein [Acidimicrobiia bacterium]|nr:DUF1684 domain-containing protein [Acidimicrobiia bacterium]